MEKTDPPKSFGVFKPVGHTVIAFRSAADLQGAAEALTDLGFAASALTRYTPGEMMAQVDRELPGASGLASIGQEMNLIKAHRALAVSGCSFLVVQVPDEEQAEQATAVAKSHRAAAAQRYGRFIIEELIDTPPGDSQVFESPDRGLDLGIPGVSTR